MKYPQRRVSFDASKPMQVFKSMLVGIFSPLSFWHVANNTEGENKWVPLHFLVIFAAHISASAVATRERMRMGYSITGRIQKDQSSEASACILDGNLRNMRGSTRGGNVSWKDRSYIYNTKNGHGVTLTNSDYFLRLVIQDQIRMYHLHMSYASGDPKRPASFYPC